MVYAQFKDCGWHLLRQSRYKSKSILFILCIDGYKGLLHSFPNRRQKLLKLFLHICRIHVFQVAVFHGVCSSCQEKRQGCIQLFSVRLSNFQSFSQLQRMAYSHLHTASIAYCAGEVSCKINDFVISCFQVQDIRCVHEWGGKGQGCSQYTVLHGDVPVAGGAKKSKNGE